MHSCLAMPDDRDRISLSRKRSFSPTFQAVI
jgi:hypothetical protein